MSTEPDFGNWLRSRRIIAIVCTGALLTLISATTPPSWCWLVLAVGLIVLLTGLFLSYIYFAFDERGGGLQHTLWRLTLDHLDGYGELSGKALDIGTGNGSLAVISARDNPDLQVLGIDMWEPAWEYSLTECISNAKLCGVSDRCEFQRESAHALPFPDETFNCVMSHFVFHEVNSASDKRLVVKEALRVLKRGGVFSFHDMFFDTGLYGDQADFIHFLKANGIDRINLIDTRKLVKTSPLLMNNRVLGRCAIICGQK